MKSSPDLTRFRDTLLEAERLYPVDQWKVDNIEVWPLIRHKVAYQYIGATGLKSSTSKGIIGRLSVLFKSIPEMVAIFWKFKLSTHKPEYIFLTKSTYRVQLNSVWYEKFCDATIDIMGDDFKSKSCILESGVDFKYKKPRYKSGSVLEVQGVNYVIGLLAEFMFRIRKPLVQLERYDEFIKYLSNASNIQFSLNEKNLARQVYRIHFLASFFSFLFKSAKLKKIFTVCYYEESGYAITLAADRLNVASVDIQHGVQGPLHFAYTPFQKIPEGGYAILPDYFWVWNKSSFENISAWKSKDHTPFLGGNPWLKTQNFKSAPLSNKPMVLVTLQPVENPLPVFLLQAMLDSAQTFAWLIRLHPRQASQRNQIESMLKEYHLLDHVEIEQATELPLPLLLKQSVVHITQWSSVVVEAFEMGVPSIVIHPTGKLIFTPEEFGSEFIHYADTSSDLLHVLNLLPHQKTIGTEPGAHFSNDIQEFILR